MNPSSARQPAWLRCRVSWQTFNSSELPLASSPQAASTPPLSSSTDPTVATADAAVVVTMVVVLAAARTVAVSHNNQPLFLAVVMLVHSNQLVSPLPPTSVGRIGTPTTPMAVMLTIPHQHNVRETRAEAQPKCKPCHNNGRINHQNAEDHLAHGGRMHTAYHAPPTAADAVPTSHILLPDAKHSLAASSPVCQLWRNVSGWWQLPPGDSHAHASRSTQPSHDVFLWPSILQAPGLCQ